MKTDHDTNDENRPHDHATEATRLSAHEAMAALRESGGFICLRYDTGDSHIEYRWNPATETFEQLAVMLDPPNGMNALDGYHELHDETAEALLTDPPGVEAAPPTPIAFTDSHYPGVNQWPDTLGWGHRDDDAGEDEQGGGDE